MQADSFSSGKIIISGEHSVVYGYPAFAIPLASGISIHLDTATQQKTVRETSPFLDHIRSVCESFFNQRFPMLEYTITSQLPPQAGLGSSAALAHAYIRAYMQVCGVQLSLPQLFELVLACETFVHHNPSGVDPAVVTYQLPLVFRKKSLSYSFEYQSPQLFPLSECLIIHSGMATETTGEMVNMVAARKKKKQLLEAIGTTTTKLLTALKNKQTPWPFITNNQRLLEKLGVVGDCAHAIITEIEAIGGYAKICGAGGIKTGSGVILAYHPNKQKLSKLASKNKWQIIAH